MVWGLHGLGGGGRAEASWWGRFLTLPPPDTQGPVSPGPQDPYQRMAQWGSRRGREGLGSWEAGHADHPGSKPLAQGLSHKPTPPVSQPCDPPCHQTLAPALPRTGSACATTTLHTLRLQPLSGGP